MKFTLRNRDKRDGLIFKGVGSYNNFSKGDFGGKFFADNPMDAGNYGDTIEVYEISDDARLFSYESSLQFLEDSGCFESNYEIVDTLSNSKFQNLGAAIDFYIYCGEDPTVGYAIAQAVAKQILSPKGYDGANWDDEDDLIPHQYQIWNYTVLTHIETLDGDDAESKYM